MTANDYRFITVTTVDGAGSPTITQLWANDPQEALAYVNEQVARSMRTKDNYGMLQQRRIRSAFVFDTKAKGLEVYDVSYSVNGIFAIDLQ